MDQARGIGKNNQLPWHLPSDLKRFKGITMGHHLIMGRKTYESIGRSLPGRTTIVLSRDPDYYIESGFVVHTIQKALSLAEERGDDEVFVIGGGELFQETINIADRIYLTRVHSLTDCDTFFPDLDDREWTVAEISYQCVDEKNPFPHTFQILNRIPAGS